mgnify:CR=1 FL=1
MSGEMTVIQYLDWKLSEVQKMVLEQRPSVDIICEIQRVRDILIKKETVVDSVAVEPKEIDCKMMISEEEHKSYD